jgi:hypothetical protein
VFGSTVQLYATEARFSMPQGCMARLAVVWQANKRRLRIIILENAK